MHENREFWVFETIKVSKISLTRDLVSSCDEISFIFSNSNFCIAIRIGDFINEGQFCLLFEELTTL
jgi:hypothetical protein